MADGVTATKATYANDIITYFYDLSTDTDIAVADAKASFVPAVCDDFPHYLSVKTFRVVYKSAGHASKSFDVVRSDCNQ